MSILARAVVWEELSRTIAIPARGEGITGPSARGILYSLKGEIVARGVKAITGLDMPVFSKRRFQHGAIPVSRLRERVTGQESDASGG